MTKPCLSESSSSSCCPDGSEVPVRCDHSPGPVGAPAHTCRPTRQESHSSNAAGVLHEEQHPIYLPVACFASAQGCDREGRTLCATSAELRGPQALAKAPRNSYSIICVMRRRNLDECEGGALFSKHCLPNRAAKRKRCWERCAVLHGKWQL